MPKTPFFGDPLGDDLLALPAILSATMGLVPFSQRNVLVDNLFYNVGDLSAEEVALLTTEINVEGSILVVWPSPERKGMRLRKFDDHAELVDAPGQTITRFVVSGVGSSDLGGAALARTLANHVKEPVGAIVAGYGVADLWTEALGGWLVLGRANQFLHTVYAVADPALVETALDTGQEVFSSSFRNLSRLGIPGLDSDALAKADPLAHMVISDTKTIIKLLADPHRDIRFLLGHSKGCLSIAGALSSVALSRRDALIQKMRAIEVMTCGAVVQLPRGIARVRQYLGSLDWFGGMNSRQDVPHIMVEGAGHHLNTALPFAMDLAELLHADADAD